MSSRKDGKPCLTPDELQRIRESWRTFMENAKDNGVFIFTLFLDKYNYHMRFPKFAGVPKSELPNNTHFLYHTASIVATIDAIISNLDRETVLKNTLAQLGRKHSKKNVTEEEFRELKGVILDFLNIKLHLSEASMKAWNKMFEYTFTFIFEGLKVDV